MEITYLNFVRHGLPMRMSEASVEYVILGGHAVIVHGYFRTTGDVNILLDPAPKMPTDFTRVPGYLSFSRYDDYIDVMTFTPGITFYECC